jgi:hypothetical protein
MKSKDRQKRLNKKLMDFRLNLKELTEVLDLMRSGKRFQERMVAGKK